jgi:hypothetical protein
MTADRQAAALDRLRAKGLGLAPHVVDGKVAPRPSNKTPAERAALAAADAYQGRGKVITPTRPPKPAEARPAAGTVFEFTIPAPCEFLNANVKLHYMAEARLVKAWRRAGLMAARRAEIPRGIERVRIDAYVIKPVRNRYDPANFSPSVKAASDGFITDHGTCEDDNLHHVDGPFMHDGGKGQPSLRIVVTVLG